MEQQIQLEQHQHMCEDIGECKVNNIPNSKFHHLLFRFLQTWPSSLPSNLIDSFRHAAVVMLQREIPEAVNLEVAKQAR